MHNLHLYKALSRLSLNSQESVHTGGSLSEYDSYLHVPRPIEEKLAAKMQAIEEAGGGIVLLVGSAGDGKSHLISHIKQHFDWPDECYYNDATASSSPKRSAIQTLRTALREFSDTKLANTTKKLVLAINLGKLNAFIDDEENKGVYNSLIQAASPIFDDDDQTPAHESERIKVVLFPDEQVFEFFPDRDDAYPVDSAFLTALLDKVVQQTDENPFYKAYQQDRRVQANAQMPLMLNFQLLSIPQIRHSIIMMVIEAIICCRLSITAREFLDFVYSILVYQQPDYSEKKAYYDALLPNMMFCGGDNLIQRAIAQLDPLRHNSKEHNQQLAVLFTSEAIPADYIDTSILPRELVARTNAFYDNGRDDRERTTKFLFRLQHLMEYHSEKGIYTSYLGKLRGVMKKDGLVLAELEEQVKTAIPRYYGSYAQKPDLVPINVQGGRYKLFAPLEFELCYIIGRFAQPEMGNFFLRFSMIWKAGDEQVALRMDYQLYSFICELNAGRLSSSRETEKNMEFGAFIRNLAKQCDCTKRLVILSHQSQETYLKKTKFGTLQLR